MKTLYVVVNDKIATYIKRYGDIVCGNSDYQIKFIFDKEWDEHSEKTARFIWNGQYFDQEFTGDICPVPVINGVESVRVGVYAGDLETTTDAVIKCRRSILCGGESPNPGSGSHYSNEAKKAALEAKVAAVDSKNSANESIEAADVATDAAAVAVAAKNEAEKHTLSHVHEWLDEHPEATTTVQNGSLTEEKFSDALKLVAIKDYVTPEMFGYVAGQGLDATDYIQQAIDTGKPCVLYGEYTIYRSIEIIGRYRQLIIEGRLNVRGQCGIILTGCYNVIGGNGEIFVMGKADNDFENVSAIQIRLSQAPCVENEITVKRILNNPEQNTNVGIEITGAETYGSGCFDKITSDLKYFSKGIWCHKSEGQNADSWYTSLQINSIIQECIQAVVIDWECGGSYLRGEIQSVYNGATILPANFDTSTPIVKVGSHWTINTFFWDMGTQGEANQSANLYAVEVTGRHCLINSSLDRKFFKIPFDLEEYTIINGNYTTRDIGVITRTDFNSRRMNAFENSNDVLLHCITNPNVTAKLAVTGDSQGEDIYSVIRETSGYRRFFDGTNTQEGISLDSTLDRYNLLFEFTEPKSIRTVALWGDILPDKISVEIATNDNPSAFTEVGVLTAGKDYFSGANYGQYNVAVYSLSYNQLGDLSARNIVALKIKLTVSSRASVTRISAFDVAPDIMQKSGGRFMGDISFPDNTKGVVITSPSGNKFRLCVNDDGILSTMAL